MQSSALQLVTPPPQDLDGVVVEIARRHADLGLLWQRLWTVAADLGDLLLVAKRYVPHGAWEAWVPEHTPYTLHQAQRFMWAARNRKVAESATFGLDVSFSAMQTAVREATMRDRKLAGLPELRALPNPSDGRLWRCEIEDARTLPETLSGEVHLQFFSPPYGVGHDYPPPYDDHLSRRQYLNDVVYPWAEESYRVAWPQGGRVCVNVPLDVRPSNADGTSGMPRPISSDWEQAMERVGFKYFTTIVWPKGKKGQTSKSAARGSESPNAPYVMSPVEHVLVFFKGDTWQRGETSRAHDKSHREFLEWHNGVWDDVQPARVGLLPGGVTAPPPFPLDLPWRGIKLFSYPEDLVMDQASGTGTTGLAAYRLGRRFLGFDVSPDCVQLTRLRRSSSEPDPSPPRE